MKLPIDNKTDDGLWNACVNVLIGLLTIVGTLIIGAIALTLTK